MKFSDAHQKNKSNNIIVFDYHRQIRRHRHHYIGVMMMPWGL